MIFRGGCTAYEVTYVVADGASDCGPCGTIDAFARSTLTRQYRAGTETVQAPHGYIAELLVKTGNIDDDGVFTAANVSTKVDLSFLSERAGLCVREFYSL